MFIFLCLKLLKQSLGFRKCEVMPPPIKCWPEMLKQSGTLTSQTGGQLWELWEQACSSAPDVLVAFLGRVFPCVPPGPTARLYLLNLFTKFVSPHLGSTELQQIFQQGFGPIQKKTLRSLCLHWTDKNSVWETHLRKCLSVPTFKNDYYNPQPHPRELPL